MRPTRWSVLLACMLLAAVGGYLLAEVAYGRLPPLPGYAPITLVLLAGTEVAMAKVVRDRVHRRSVRGARPLHPVQVARSAALAKASSPTGALLLGGYLGLFAWTLPREADQAAADAIVCAVSAAASFALVVAALLLERACRTPDDDEQPTGARG